MTDLDPRIGQRRGDAPADLVLRGGQVFDVVTGAEYDGQRVIDVTELPELAQGPNASSSTTQFEDDPYRGKATTLIKVALQSP